MGRMRREKPPKDSGGGKKHLVTRLLLQRVAALAILTLGGQNLAAHLLTYGAGQEAAYRVSLPAGGLHELGPGGGNTALVGPNVGLGFPLAGFPGLFCGFHVSAPCAVRTA